MCLSPIVIRNNSRSFVRGASPLYVECPCGECQECISSVQNDWFLRLFYEWQDCKQKNGRAFFITLTFNPDNLPVNCPSMLDDVKFKNWMRHYLMVNADASERAFYFRSDWEIDALDFQPFPHCYFDRALLSRFFKSLRQSLSQKYAVEGLKFFVSCEYGEEYHRPHFHVIMFVPFCISDADFKWFVQYSWSHRVKKEDYPDFIKKRLENKSSLKNGVTTLSTPNGKNWNDWFIKKSGNHIYVKHLIGFCNYSKKCGAVIDSVGGFDYVCKYVHKKDTYLDDDRFAQLKSWLKIFPRSLDDIRKNSEFAFKYIHRLRQYFPFCHSSNFLGIGIMKEFELKTDDEIAKMCSEKSIEVPTVERKFNVPRYIVNRVMFEKDDLNDGVLKLTDIGKKTLAYRLDKKVEQYADSMMRTDRVLSGFLYSDEIKMLKAKYPYVLRPSIEGYKQIAYYRYLLKDVECPPGLMCFEVQPLIDTFVGDIFDAKIDRKIDVDVPPSACFPREVAVRSRNTFNYQPCFDGYDSTIDYLKEVRKIVFSRKYETKKAEMMHINDIRSALNAYVYR